jgi:N-acetylglucosamine-6-phosphate deacetylase
MAYTVVSGGALYTPATAYKNGVVLIEGSRIRAAGPYGAFSLPENGRRIDAGGQPIIPGLIDVHLHGMEGIDCSGEGLATLIRRLPAHGITTFLPTTYASAWGSLRKFLRIMSTILDVPPAGACAPGIHMEGPWFSPHRSGMASADLFYPLSVTDVAAFQEAAGGWIRMVTFAPEEGSALEAIPWLVKHNIIPTAGHTDADYDTISHAVALGLRHATHTYNAMRGLHHREPGALGAIMDHDAIVAQLIADGHHVHPAAMRILLRVKGVERVCLVSDATPPAGGPPGEYEWLGYTLYHDGETSRLQDGTLAGSVTLVNQMLRVLVEEVGIPFVDALQMATTTPARMLGVRKGELRPGYDADLVILGEGYIPALTMVGGEVVYEA